MPIADNFIVALRSERAAANNGYHVSPNTSRPACGASDKSESEHD